MYFGIDSAPGAFADDAEPVASGQAGVASVSKSRPVGHQPVLVRESLGLLQQHRVPGAPHFLDCTFGGGGHSCALLESDPEARVTALDRDPAAGGRAREVEARFGGRFHFCDLPFSRLHKLTEAGYAGALFDLGVSSFQLDEPGRGFSFRHAAPADMRLDPRAGRSAAEFLEEASHEELVAAVRDAGEEPRWRKVVSAILRARGSGQLARTDTLAELVAGAVGGPPGRFPRIHPATRTFQGLRITVNDELGELESALPQAVEKLAPGGVLAVISFHSLEDRIVKRFCNLLAGRPEHANDARPAQERVAHAELLTRRPLTPSEEEVAANPRSRSAKLRGARLLQS
jgi:16S rRNA (cytosine1402-N4)-methyltransferase